MAYPQVRKIRINKTEYESKLADIKNRKDLSPILRKMAINSLTRRFNNDVEYYTPDASGYSQADRDSLLAYRKDLIWRATKLGLSKDKAEGSNNDFLAHYIHAQEKLGKKVIYDESEFGSPGASRENSASYTG